ncbi:hypothetical protein V1527DRAFT_518499 [Lipomyces starkeyi]
MMFPKKLNLLLLGFSVIASATTSIAKSVSPVPANGPSIMITTSSQGPFDGPKLDKVNDTSFEWWYFDICSEKSSIQILFVTSTLYAAGHPGTGINLVTYVLLDGTFPNGTAFNYFIPSSNGSIETVGDGSSGYFESVGSWHGSQDMSSYTITIDSETIDAKGALYFRSAGLPHYPFNFAAERDNSTEVLAPNFGWANAVPDADAHADLAIGDIKLHIVGRGYHDKNWGIAPMQTLTKTWYWGHAKVGPYSIVWFDYISSNEQEYYSVYLAKDGVPILLGASITVRPYGSNKTQSEYPPSAIATNPDGFIINVDAGYAGKFEFNASNHNLVQSSSTYARWTGEVTGGPVGGEHCSGRGVGLWEWMHFLA